MSATGKDAWTEIARRAAEAKGADDVLDADVWFVAGQPLLASDRTSPPSYTASLVAVLALIEERLPGWGIDVNRAPDGVMTEVFWDAELTEPGRLYYSGGCPPKADASTAPLALLSAFALAMAEQTGVAE